MRAFTLSVAAIVAAFFGCRAAFAATPGDSPPSWAFVIFQDPGKAAPPQQLVSVPGSNLKVPEKQLDDPFDPPDWFPGDHPRMPTVVAHGRPPKVWACSYCHLQTGVGGPDSAVIAGLPAAYIEQQVGEFRAGRRRCAVTKDIACSKAMPEEAATLSPSDLEAAAGYYSSLRYRSRIHVVEAAMVPKIYTDTYFLAAAAGDAREPIGDRILELPDPAVLQEDGDWRGSITAYVPPGSLARGKALVTKGTGTAPCATCHGARLQGDGTLVPPLAGRSPTYLYRQLYDIQYGFRRGRAVEEMEPQVAHLTAKDRLAIAAYLASLPGS